MNGCPKGEEWVAYVAGEVAPRLHRMLAAHLDVCPACRREVEDLARGLEALGALAHEPPLRPEAMERLRRRLRVAAAHPPSPGGLRRTSPPARPRVVRLFVRYGWAAAAAVLIAAALLWHTAAPDQATLPLGNHHAEAIEEIAAAIELLDLADNGTRSERLDRLPGGGAAEEIHLFLELDDAGLLLDYLLSQDGLRG
ncbi:MAG TPA: zf-HC2 domain-containing protein [Phycisphaerae bacterium]|nr:zf-HC2 domain-containing protein [Phycisphaerae bacterium]